MRTSRGPSHTPEPQWKPSNQAYIQRYPLPTAWFVSPVIFLPFFRLGLACFRLLHLGPSAMISCFIDKCVWDQMAARMDSIP